MIKKLDKNQLNKIKKLNEAWQCLSKGIKIIKEVLGKDNYAMHLLWKTEKINNKLQSYICKKIELDYIDEEFKKMVKRLKEK